MKTVTHTTLGTGIVMGTDDRFVTVDFNGAQKRLLIQFCNLTNEDGTKFTADYIAVADLPVKEVKKYRKSVTKEYTPKMEINRIMRFLPAMIEDEKGFTFVQLIADHATGFVSDVANSVISYRRISEKQCYVIAKYAVDNSIEFNANL